MTMGAKLNGLAPGNVGLVQNVVESPRPSVAVQCPRLAISDSVQYAASGISAHCKARPGRPAARSLVQVTAMALDEPKANTAIAVATVSTTRPASCATITLTSPGNLTERSRPATSPYAHSSIIISGSMASIGMPDSRKLTSGAAAPAIAPTAGPAISPTKIIGRCIGRNATPKAVPCPDTAPMTWNNCGSATAAAMASSVAAALVVRLSFGRS